MVFMEKICKNLLFVVLLTSSTLFWGCIWDSDERVANVYPDNGLRFRLIPNDAAVNDSASANLAHGLTLMVHPNAVYELSFDTESSLDDAPTLQLFRTKPVENNESLVSLSKVKNVYAQKIDGRFVYKFSCEKSVSENWAVTLEQKGTFYEGPTNNVRLKGDGAYSDHMSVNLIVVGNIASKIKDFSIDDLAEDLLAAYRTYYTSIEIDTLYVNYADKHPTLGSKYPANEAWYAGWSSEDKMMSELGGWPGIEKALDIVLVEYINDEDILGYSNLFSGNMGGGRGSTVVLGAFVKNEKGVSPLIEKDIIETALHETGHFFGLRHSTTTTADIGDGGDFSNLEDGFDDTPFCSGLWFSPLSKKRAELNIDDLVIPRIRIGSVGLSYDYRKCPDATNIMFPYDIESEYDGFSEQQLATLRASLMIYPH